MLRILCLLFFGFSRLKPAVTFSLSLIIPTTYNISTIRNHHFPQGNKLHPPVTFLWNSGEQEKAKGKGQKEKGKSALPCPPEEWKCGVFLLFALSFLLFAFTPFSRSGEPAGVVLE